LTTGVHERVLEVYYQIRAIKMLVIVGLIVLLVAAVFAIVGVLSNTGAAHPLTENFSVFGYHVTGSTGSLFLFGIVVGAVALLGLSVLLAGVRRRVGRGRGARREVARFQREMAFGNRDRDTRPEHQHRADTGATPTVNSGEGATPRHATPRRRSPLLGRWSRVRQPISTGQSNGHRSVGPLSQ
jgi:hypothetical protein